MARDYKVEPEPTEAKALVKAQQRGGMVTTKPSGGDVAALALEPVSLRDSTFKLTGTKAVTKAQKAILTAPIDPVKETDILPTGEVYMSHVHMRRRLNEAFGPMGWALRPLMLATFNEQAKQMLREFALIAHGRVVATAFGSAKYYPTNDRMDYADTTEAVRSNALTRCCKDLGIGSECWDRRFTEEWKDQYAVHVYVAEKERKKVDGYWKYTGQTVQKDYWRRLDAKPFHGEVEPVKDSPNQEKWRQQMTGWIAVIETEHKASREIAKKVQQARREFSEEMKSQAQPNPKPPDEPPPAQPPATTTNADEFKPAGNARGAREPQQHGTNGVHKDERKYLIRSCRIAAKGDNWTCYKITFMDGSEYTTFSDTTYEKMQHHFAARDMVDITQVETKTKGRNTYRNIVEWEVLKYGDTSRRAGFEQ